MPIDQMAAAGTTIRALDRRLDALLAIAPDTKAGIDLK